MPSDLSLPPTPPGHVGKAHALGNLSVRIKGLRSDKVGDRHVLLGGPHVLAQGHHVNAVLPEQHGHGHGHEHDLQHGHGHMLELEHKGGHEGA